MTNENYWLRRQLERERFWHEQIGKDLRGDVKRYFELALSEILRDVESLYARFAKDNRLTMTEARRLLKGEEFRIWRMALKEYVKAAENDAAILKELNTLAMRSRINRLESLHAQTLMEVADLAGKLDDKATEILVRAYLENRYGNLFDIQKKIGLATPPVVVDRKQVEAVLMTPWSGKNYSQRIWRNMQALGTAIKDTVLTAIHRGSSIQKLSADLSRRMEVGYSNAERLVRTELNFVVNKAAADAIQAAEIEHYRFVAVLDHRTTPICQSLDGQVFPLEEMQQGENAPPMHVRCRSTIIASFGESYGRGTRVARDREGRNIRIPADMNYNDWKHVFIDKTMTLKEWQARHLQSGKVNGNIKAKFTALTPQRQQQIKDAEDKAFRTPTGKDFGFKKMQEMPDWAKELMIVNGDGKGLERMINCLRCVVAHEARMRGFDVMARPSWGKDDPMRTLEGLLSVFKNADSRVLKLNKEELAGNILKSVEKIISSSEPNSRFFVWFDWDTVKTGKVGSHIMIAQSNNKEEVVWGDPQSKERAALYKLKEAVPESIKIMRVDDLAFTDNVKRCCMGRND